MFFWIPGELIAFITFPGVVVHEIAHRFFCDVFDVPVYEINYFRPLSKTAGHVVHQPTESFWASFFIGMAPFFINSFLCMLLTFPKGITYFLGTSFLSSSEPSHLIPRFILYWAGFSMGFNAIPSEQDLSGLLKKTNSFLGSLGMAAIHVLFWPFHVNGIGPVVSLGYAYLLSLFLPYMFLG